MNLLHILVCLFSFVLAAIAATPTIQLPASGTAIKPGSVFDFKYQSIADYGTTSYNYTVWLFTSMPAGNFIPLDDYASGYFFGRFAEPNYPGNPNPSNRAPPQLTMPNFSMLAGGFGSGGQTSNATFYLTILEEYATQQGSVGYKISLVYNPIRYNVTD